MVKYPLFERFYSSGGGWIGIANPPIRYDLLTKSAVKFSQWIRNPGKNICVTRKVQSPGPKNRWIHIPLKFPKSGQKYFQNPPIRLPIQPPPSGYWQVTKGDLSQIISSLHDSFLFRSSFFIQLYIYQYQLGWNRTWNLSQTGSNQKPRTKAAS